MCLILIGFFSAGKSTVGEAASQRLSLAFLDTDRELERMHMKKVEKIFEEVGEKAFRNLERGILRSLPQRELLLATGGGIITVEENRALLKKRGAIIYLQASLNTLLKRMEKRRYPYYAKENPQEQLTSLWQTRHPLYEELADFTIATDHLSVDDVVQKVCDYGKQ